MLIDIVKKIIYREKYNSDTYIEFLRKKGITIGKDCTIYVPTKTFIDTQYPFMIKIGDHVKITLGVIILTHDYSWSVLKNNSSESEGAILGGSGPVNIGNNVFIGMNAIICRNVNIGDNVIIGAGSVVVKDCESDSVYAGNPAKKIMSVNQFYNKRRASQFKEAKEIFSYYYKKYKKIPSKKIFREYFMLFEDEQSIKKDNLFYIERNLGLGEKSTFQYMKNNKKSFENYDEFILECLKDNK